MDDQAAVGIDIGCNTGTAVIGHAAAQIDAEGLVTLPIGGKALGLIGVERTVKAEIRQILRQPLGVGGGIDRHTLQGKAGAVGQAGGIEIGLRLGKVDADAHHDAVAVRRALAEDADDLFAVQQQVVGPFDLTFHAVAGMQGIADGKAGKERQGGRLHKVYPDDMTEIMNAEKSICWQMKEYIGSESTLTVGMQQILCVCLQINWDWRVNGLMPDMHSIIMQQ